MDQANSSDASKVRELNSQSSSEFSWGAEAPDQNAVTSVSASQVQAEEKKVEFTPETKLVDTFPEEPIITSFPYENFDCDLDNCKEYLDEHGVVVIPGIMNSDELTTSRNEMYDLLEHMLQSSTPPFKRDDPATWNSFSDLFPIQGMLLHNFQIGHAQFAWNIRQHPGIADVFSHLWDSEPNDMITSYDGMSIHLPPEETNGFGFFSNSIWFHVDQSYIKSQFQCIQGFITLWDVDEGDATLACWPQSHKYHDEFGKRFELANESKSWHYENYQQMGKDAAKTAWLKNKGLAPRCVKAKAGSLILWDSRTMHQGIQCVKGRSNPKPRCVVYVCQKPRNLADEGELKKRQQAFQDSQMTSHWPYPVKTFGLLPQSRLDTIQHIRMPFQKPGRLEPIWIDAARKAYSMHCDESRNMNKTNLHPFLNYLQKLGFEPEEELKNELMRLAENSTTFEEIYNLVANTEKPQLTALGMRLAGFD